MNKEYKYLSNKEILVLDDKKRLTKRNIENIDINNIENILLIENKLELINSIITNYKSKLNKEEKIKFNEYKKELFLCITIIISLTVVLFYTLNKYIILKYLGIIIGIGKTIDYLSTYISEVKLYNNYIKEIENKLETAYTIKNNYEQELINLKSNNKTSKNNNIKINETIKLEENNEYIYETYIKSNNKGLKKVLKKQ